MDTWIITGANRGLGEGLAKSALAAGHRLITLGRSPFPQKHANYLEHIQVDLSKSQKTADSAKTLVQILQKLQGDKIILVNNAGILGRLDPIKDQSLEDMENVIQVNLMAPMILSGAFAQFAHKNPHLECHILNISSGAGRRTTPGWGAYCVSKAGLDMLSLAMADDENLLGGNLKIYSLAPGVVATQMQNSIRQVGDRFPWGEKFQKYFENGELSDPEALGSEILQALYEERIPHGVLSDVRKL